MATTIGGIVLCGGRSSRMGQPKAWLPFGPQTLLQRVVQVLADVVEPVVVVAAPDQQLPTLPADVEVTFDAQEGLGPLAGLAAGLEVLRGRTDAAYATAVDTPLLQPDFVRGVIARLGDADIAIPIEDGFHHPLAAVYRTHLATRCQSLLDSGDRRPLHLVQASRAHEFDVAELVPFDPELLSLRNANTPEEYSRLLAIAGYDGGQTPTAEPDL